MIAWSYKWLSYHWLGMVNVLTLAKCWVRYGLNSELHGIEWVGAKSSVWHPNLLTDVIDRGSGSKQVLADSWLMRLVHSF